MTHPRYSGPVVDAHVHVDGENLAHTGRVAARNGIETMVDLWNGQLPPPGFDGWKRELENAARAERSNQEDGESGSRGLDVLPYHTPDLSRVTRPGFADSITSELRLAAEAGATGIKVWKNLGLHVREESGGVVAVDDPRLDPLWRDAGELGLPISIHIADPVAFFQPLDEENERYEELSLHPEWWFGGEEFPSFEEIIGQFENVVARNSRTTFVGVHMGCYAEDLEFVGRMLDSYPNYFVDTSARIAEFARHGASKVREFFVEYADRILFGTDLARTDFLWLPESRFYDPLLEGFYDLHWRYFETDEKGLAHPFPEQGDWTVDGIDLPDEMLEKLYHENARRVIPALADEEHFEAKAIRLRDSTETNREDARTC